MTDTAKATSRAKIARSRIRILDLAWLTWRQHRVVLCGTVLAALAYAGYLVWTDGRLREVTRQSSQDTAGQLSTDWWNAVGLVDGLPFLALVIAVFWAAPLLSREYEQRTHLLAWSQDVTPLRWLAGKAGLMAVVAVCLAVVLGTTADNLLQNASPHYSPFSRSRFEAFAPLQVGHALFGLALGLALSALSRRTTLAIGGTLVLFVGIRWTVFQFRPHFLPPLRQLTPATEDQSLPLGGLTLDSTYLDAAGNRVVTLLPCHEQDFNSCLEKRGITTQLLEYQPFERITTFRMIETAIFVLLAIGLSFLAWYRIRKETVS